MSGGKGGREGQAKKVLLSPGKLSNREARYASIYRIKVELERRARASRGISGGYYFRPEADLLSNGLSFLLVGATIYIGRDGLPFRRTDSRESSHPSWRPGERRSSSLSLSPLQDPITKRLTLIKD